MLIARSLFVVSGLCALGMVANAQSDAASGLKKIMQGLRNDTVLIMDALLVGDMDTVADAAERISDHPQIPPDQVSLVAAELGPEMAAFKQFDTLVHDLSVSMREAADGNDPVSAERHFRDMIAGCLGCHSKYRQRVMSVLADGRPAR